MGQFKIDFKKNENYILCYGKWRAWQQGIRSEYSLMQGAMGLFVLSYPAAQLSHCRRVTPSLHGHCPVF